MARYRWWQHYVKQTPHPLPATFADGPSKVVVAYFGPLGGGSRLYYTGVAALFRATDMTKQGMRSGPYASEREKRPKCRESTHPIELRKKPGKAFLDSNVLAYAQDTASPKRQQRSRVPRAP